MIAKRWDAMFKVKVKTGLHDPDCLECKGKGEVVLFSTSGPCRTCGVRELWAKHAFGRETAEGEHTYLGPDGRRVRLWTVSDDRQNALKFDDAVYLGPVLAESWGLVDGNIEGVIANQENRLREGRDLNTCAKCGQAFSRLDLDGHECVEPASR